jgi:APA family basic amino acid/polyamine antiporter
MLTYTMTVATSAFFVPHYIGGLFWEPLRHSPGDIIAGAIVIAVLSVINVVGVKESTGVNVLLAVVDFATQLLLVIVGIVVVLSPQTLVDNVDLGTAPTWSQFLLAIPIGMLAYTGIETISNMAEEARDETKTIPGSIARVRLAVFAIYFTLPAVALSALPVKTAQPGDPAVLSGAVDVGERYTLLGLTEEQGGYAGDPILGVVKSMDLGPLQNVGEIYVGLLAATILFLATNAGLIGVSRLVYSMGIHRQLPDALRQLHPKYQTPWIGILLFGAIAVVAILPGEEGFLGSLYSFGALLSFTMAHAAVARLRATQPDRERPYRGPWNVRIGNYDAPLFAFIGGTFTAAAFVIITVLNPKVAAAGVGWLVLGLVVYLVFRRHQGLDLTTTHKVAIPQPVLDHEAEYDSVLVALNAEDGYDPQVVATATKLAARRRHGIHVIALVPVPYALPMDAPVPDLEQRAATMIEQARVQGGRRVTGHVERVRPGQAGRRIIEEAVDMRASAIVMGLPRRVSGASLFGKTVETVLAARPCRVIIESSPDPTRGAAYGADRIEAGT